mmetsp:Transcript_66899/g.139675  ORF Transcript_66899/g.139675 Transcript_66899/m.139675 type:complete len:115 (+) Transcript_66899:442-786(+)
MWATSCTSSRRTFPRPGRRFATNRLPDADRASRAMMRASLSMPNQHDTTPFLPPLEPREAPRRGGEDGDDDTLFALPGGRGDDGAAIFVALPVCSWPAKLGDSENMSFVLLVCS